MAARSEIEWTTHTWGITTGCSRVGPECDNCYAMGMAHRFSWGRHLTTRHRVKLNVVGSRERRSVDMVDWNGKIDLHPDRLDQPLRWREGANIFVCSTADLFHHRVPFDFIAKAFGVMAVADHHNFQILTKRPERLAEFVKWLKSQSMSPSNVLHEAAFEHFMDLGETRLHKRVYEHGSSPWPLPNVWLGTSVGVRDAKPRIDVLREVPAAVRFLSLEPLLEDLGELDLRGIHWVIAGGESGARARPMHPDWARSIRDQCAEAGVAFFFKQHGAFGSEDAFGHCKGRRMRFDDGHTVVRVGKKKAGRLLDGQLHEQMPA
jgi:protein gp37